MVVSVCGMFCVLFVVNSVNVVMWECVCGFMVVKYFDLVLFIRLFVVIVGLVVDGNVRL